MWTRPFVVSLCATGGKTDSGRGVDRVVGGTLSRVEPLQTEIFFFFFFSKHETNASDVDGVQQRKSGLTKETTVERPELP